MHHYAPLNPKPEKVIYIILPELAVNGINFQHWQCYLFFRHSTFSTQITNPGDASLLVVEFDVFMVIYRSTLFLVFILILSTISSQLVLYLMLRERHNLDFRIPSFTQLVVHESGKQKDHLLIFFVISPLLKKKRFNVFLFMRLCGLKYPPHV